MADTGLKQCRVLVVEDEYFIAEDIRSELKDLNAIVLGPVASLDQAMRLILAEPKIDAAILDINLRGDMVFPVADQLVRRRVPFVFATGYDDDMIPTRFRHIARCDKPIDVRRIVSEVENLIGKRAA